MRGGRSVDARVKLSGPPVGSGGESRPPSHTHTRPPSPPLTHTPPRRVHGPTDGSHRAASAARNQVTAQPAARTREVSQAAARARARVGRRFLLGRKKTATAALKSKKSYFRNTFYGFLQFL